MAYIGFRKLEGQLAKRPGVTNPGALAAYIGKRKYGNKTFNRAAATHTSLAPKAKKRAHRMQAAQRVLKG